MKRIYNNATEAISISNISGIEPQKNSFIIEQFEDQSIEFITNGEYLELNSWLTAIEEQWEDLNKHKDPYHSMLPIVKSQIINKGFAKFTENTIIQQCNYLVTGYSRIMYKKFKIPNEINKFIQNYLLLMNLLCWNGNYVVLKSGGKKEQSIFVISKQRCILSKYITKKSVHINNGNGYTMMECNQIPGDTLELIMIYLAQHNGIEPGPIACPVRSLQMIHNVTYKWDAQWIDKFDKKTVFEVILAANKLEIKNLLHLGCAKIATLIKALDQAEINRIIDQEEEYRRKQAEAQKLKEGLVSSLTDGKKEEKEENVIQGLDDDEEENKEESKENDDDRNMKQDVYYVEFTKRPFGVRVCCMDEKTKTGGCITDLMPFGDENREKCIAPSQIVFINDGVNNEDVRNKSNFAITATLADVRLPFKIGLMKMDKNPCTREHHLKPECLGYNEHMRK